MEILRNALILLSGLIIGAIIIRLKIIIISTLNSKKNNKKG